MGRKIEIRRVLPATGAAVDAFVILAQDGDAKSASISAFQFPAFGWSPQNVPCYQGLAPFVANNGNGLLKSGFTVMRSFDSLGAAAADLAADAAYFQTLLNFNLKVTDDGTVYQVLNCAVVEWTPEPDHNRTTVVRYGFEGGTFVF